MQRVARPRKLKRNHEWPRRKEATCSSMKKDNVEDVIVVDEDSFNRDRSDVYLLFSRLAEDKADIKPSTNGRKKHRDLN